MKNTRRLEFSLWLVWCFAIYFIAAGGAVWSPKVLWVFVDLPGGVALLLLVFSLTAQNVTFSRWMGALAFFRPQRSEWVDVLGMYFARVGALMFCLGAVRALQTIGQQVDLGYAAASAGVPWVYGLGIKILLQWRSSPSSGRGSLAPSEASPHSGLGPLVGYLLFIVVVLNWVMMDFSSGSLVFQSDLLGTNLEWKTLVLVVVPPLAWGGYKYYSQKGGGTQSFPFSQALGNWVMPHSLGLSLGATGFILFSGVKPETVGMFLGIQMLAGVYGLLLNLFFGSGQAYPWISHAFPLLNSLAFIVVYLFMMR